MISQLMKPFKCHRVLKIDIKAGSQYFNCIAGTFVIKIKISSSILAIHSLK